MTFAPSLDKPRLSSGARAARLTEACTVQRLDGRARIMTYLRTQMANAAASAFQTPDWLDAWLETMCRDSDTTVHLVTACDATDGTPLLVLPLVRFRQGGLTRLEAPDSGLADYVGPLLAPDFCPDKPTMTALWQQFLSALPPADILYLGKIPPTIRGRANPLLLVDGIHRHRQSAWGTILNGPPVDFGAFGMPKKRTRELNNRWKRLEALGKLAFVTATSPEEKERYFAELCDQRATRFRALNRPNSLDRPEVRAFFRHLLDHDTGPDRAEIQVLKLDDTVIATGLGLVSGGAFHMIFPTIGGEEWRAYSPGLQHFRQSMEKASAEGLRYYDFTLGSEAYKVEFGARQMPLYEIVVPITTLGSLHAAMLSAKRAFHSRPELVRFLRHCRQTFRFGAK